MKCNGNLLNPQFLCVNTLADSMGPYGLNTLRMVAGVVVDGIEPIHKALVGVDCSCASIPPEVVEGFGDFPGTAPGEVGPGLTGVPLAGATGALSALPKPIRTV
jgi:hypothetical protein